MSTWLCLVASCVVAAVDPKYRNTSAVAAWTSSQFPPTLHSELRSLVNPNSSSCDGLPTTTDVLDALKANSHFGGKRLIYVIFVERQMDTFNFLVSTGAYTDDKTGQFYTLKEMLTNSAAVVFTNLNVVPQRYNDLVKFVNELSLVTPTMMLTDCSGGSCTCYHKDVIIGGIGDSVDSVCTKSQSPLCKEGGIVVVDLQANKNTPKGKLMKKIFDEVSSTLKIGIFISTWDSPLADDVAGHPALNMTETTKHTDAVRHLADLTLTNTSALKAQLRILPWQLTAIITLAFTFLMIIIMLKCLLAIDVAKNFETKCLPNNKEF